MYMPEENIKKPEPFLELLGARWIEVDSRDHRAELLIEPQHCNKWMMAHGGVIMTLLDVVMSRVCRLADSAGRVALTVEMKSSFVRPGRGRLTVHGTCLHSGRGTAFAEAKVLDERSNLVAFGTGTFKYYATSSHQAE